MCSYCEVMKSSLLLKRRFSVRAMLKQLSPILSISEISRSMARILPWSRQKDENRSPGRDIWQSLSPCCQRCPRISRCGYRVYKLFFIGLAKKRLHHTEHALDALGKQWISFCASKTEISGVFMIPLWIKRRRKSSSSAFFLGRIILHTSFSICGMNHTRIKVLARLKVVWKAASTKDSLAALATNEDQSSPWHRRNLPSRKPDG